MPSPFATVQWQDFLSPSHKRHRALWHPASRPFICGLLDCVLFSCLFQAEKKQNKTRFQPFLVCYFFCISYPCFSALTFSLFRADPCFSQTSLQVWLALDFIISDQRLVMEPSLWFWVELDPKQTNPMVLFPIALLGCGSFEAVAEDKCSGGLPGS